MGCQQVYHWAVLYPDFFDLGVGLAGSATTSHHNICFLEGPKNALTYSRDFKDGEYTTRPLDGIKAFGRAYSAWALSAPWFRQKLWEKAGHETLEAYLVAEWDDFNWDANDLLCLLHTWQEGSIVYPQFNNSYEEALGSIKARMLIMPCRTDQYFPPEDSEFEVKHMKNAKLKVIESVWGHIGGGCAVEPDATFISDAIKEELGRSSSRL